MCGGTDSSQGSFIIPCTCMLHRSSNLPDGKDIIVTHDLTHKKASPWNCRVSQTTDILYGYTDLQ